MQVQYMNTVAKQPSQQRYGGTVHAGTVHEYCGKAAIATKVWGMVHVCLSSGSLKDAPGTVYVLLSKLWLSITVPCSYTLSGHAPQAMHSLLHRLNFLGVFVVVEYTLTLMYECMKNWLHSH